MTLLCTFLIWPLFRGQGRNPGKSFVGIFVQTMTTKGHYEINWPLVKLRARKALDYIFCEILTLTLFANKDLCFCYSLICSLHFTNNWNEWPTFIFMWKNSVYKQSGNSTAEIMLIDTISLQHLSRQCSHESWWCQYKNIDKGQDYYIQKYIHSSIELG